MSDDAPGPLTEKPYAGLRTVRAADVEPVPIRWLWPGRIAIGKLVMIAGDPGLGKSLFTIDLAYRVSRGRDWPVDGGQAPLGNVLIVSAEDDAADTIVPRLLAAGGDPERVHILDCVKDYNAAGEPVDRELSLERDIELISARLSELDCKLVIIDPVSAYLGHIDSHKNTDVRSVLAPLSRLAQAAGVAMVLVSHLNKGGGSAAYRVTGSIAFTAAVRASLLVVKDQDDPLRRLVIPGKNNLGPDDLGGIAYRVVQDVAGRPHLEFDPDRVTVSADEALSPVDEEQAHARDEAEEFLRDYLAAGPVPAKDVFKAAGVAGIAKRTLERAKARVPVYSGKREFSGGTWFWSLNPLKTAKTDPSPQTLASFVNGGGLRTESDENTSKDATENEERQGSGSKANLADFDNGYIGADGKWHMNL